MNHSIDYNQKNEAIFIGILNKGFLCVIFLLISVYKNQKKTPSMLPIRISPKKCTQAITRNISIRIQKIAKTIPIRKEIKNAIAKTEDQAKIA